jgi:hypothetical protein
MILAPTPVSIDLLVLSTTATLLDMPMLSLIVCIDHSVASVAPDHRQMATINFDFHDHPHHRVVESFLPPCHVVQAILIVLRPPRASALVYKGRLLRSETLAQRRIAAKLIRSTHSGVMQVRDILQLSREAELSAGVTSASLLLQHSFFWSCKMILVRGGTHSGKTHCQRTE